MASIIVGYGEYDGYRLVELPDKALEHLQERYPLRSDEQYTPSYEESLVVLAIHGELSRRKAGGKPEQRLPTLRELAEEIISKGYQQASKHYHPDSKGQHEAQLLLTQAREELRNASLRLPNNRGHANAITITAKGLDRPARHEAFTEGLSDDDVPF